MTLRKRAIQLATLVAALTVVSAAAWTSAARADDDVKVRFSWKMKGEYGPFFLALENGYYKNNHVSVHMGEGAGAPAALGALIQGQEDVVVLQGIFAVSAIQKGMPIRMIALYIPKVPVVLISQPDNPLRTPKEMEGRSIAVAVGDTGTTFLRAFAAKNGVDYDKIKRVQIDAQSRAAYFVQRKVDLMTGFKSNDLPALEKATGTKYPTIDMSKFGLAIPGLAIVTSTATLAKRPDVLKRYLAAVDKGISDSKKDADAATRAVMKSWPNSPAADVVGLQVKETMEAIEEVPGKPYGWVDPALITSTLELLKTDEDIGTPKPADVFFTNDLLPK
jgi:NitT/TauT family transport system substrate-binding protein